MINRSALFIAAFILVLVSVCNAQTMFDMKDEAGMKYKQADAEMTRIYKMARDTCDSAGKERLKKAQLAWIKYRDLCCEAEAMIYEGGSMSGLAYSNCMIDVTKERTNRLKSYDVENSWK
jgi:uncharacterized protein YecT (DUF1311 family)